MEGEVLAFVSGWLLVFGRTANKERGTLVLRPGIEAMSSALQC